MKSKLPLKSYLQFIVLCAGGWSIYQVAYMRYSYYDAYLEAFTMTNEQFGFLFSMYAMMTIATYFLGGVLADKISPRKLLAFSFGVTGLLNFWFGTFPGYAVAIIIYAIMGVSTTLTFWAALIKATRQFGKVVGEGKAQGGLEGGRNIVGSVFGTLLIVLYGMFSSMSAGLRSVIFFHGAFLIALAVMTWFVFEEVDESAEEKIQHNPLEIAIECLKNRNVWVMAFIIFFAYSITSSATGYISRYATSVFGLSALVAAYIGQSNIYLNPFGSISGGFVGDKIGISRALIIAIGGMCATIMILGYMPKGEAFVYVFVTVFCIFSLFYGMTRGLYYATMKEANIPMRLSGSTIGIMATIGYLPDVLLPPIYGRILDSNTPEVAYQYIFTSLTVLGVLGIIVICIFRSMNKENIQRIEEEKKTAIGKSV